MFIELYIMPHTADLVPSICLLVDTTQWQWSATLSHIHPKQKRNPNTRRWWPKTTPHTLSLFIIEESFDAKIFSVNNWNRYWHCDFSFADYCTSLVGTELKLKKVQAKEDIALSQDQYIGPSDIWEGKTHWFQICAEGRICPCLSVWDG